jgi:hypothetical protein
VSRPGYSETRPGRTDARGVAAAQTIVDPFDGSPLEGAGILIKQELASLASADRS